MSDELDVLKSVTGLLEGAGIPYMVTGSMAANFYAVPRMTRDIDLVTELFERDVDRVVRLFQQEYYIDRDMVLRAVRDHAMFNMIHNALVVKVDCIVRKETEYRREEFARRRAVSIAGRQVYIVSAEDLILSKLDWAKESRSQMQLEDVRNLLRSMEGLDTEYLTRWVDRPGADQTLSRGKTMRDTSPAMDARYRSMLLQRSGEERFKMGCAMRDTARALVEASIRERDPQATPEALRKGLFLRLYGHEFDAESRAKILVAIEAATHPVAK